MKRWIEQNRILIVLNSVVLLCIAIAWILYALFGHRLIEAMYKGEAIEFLNSIIEGQSIHPLAHYLQDADSMMWVMSLLIVALSSILTILINVFPSSLSVLKLATPFWSRFTFTVLTLAFVLISLLVSAIVFFYPLEIETRESTVWLAVLALKAGINIYDQSQVVFVNLNHGPFDPLLKSAIAMTFPFLESWQVTRLPVFILPYLFWVLAWKMVGKSAVESFLHVLFLGSVGYLFLVVSAKEFLFVGRSDPTVAVLLLILLCISISSSTKTIWVTALHGFLSGLLGTLVILTNWRTGPTAVAILLFTFWKLRTDRQASRELMGVYVASCAIASVITSGLMLYHVSNLNLAVYYQYFFGFYSNAAGWSIDASYNGSVITFLLSLFNPIAAASKGGPLLLALAVYAVVPGKGESANKGWLLLGSFSFLFCAIAYYMNYWGGGQWYFIPFLIILWFFFCTNFSRITLSKLTLLGLCALVLLCLNVQTVIFPTLQRVITMERARQFMTLVRGLQNTNSVLSEDTFLFRTSYQGELIDMGDTVSVFAKSAYFGGDFKQTVKRHFDQVRSNPPDYIITGFTESPELRTLIEEKYILIAEGPNNLTANYSNSSKLFMRKDLITSVARASGEASGRLSPAGSRLDCCESSTHNFVTIVGSDPSIRRPTRSTMAAAVTTPPRSFKPE